MTVRLGQIKKVAAKASFEVLIVVVGVLLALGANALYNRSVEREQANNYLIGLNQDLRSDSVLYRNLLAPKYLPSQASSVDSLIAVLRLSSNAANSEGWIFKHLRNSMLLLVGTKNRATFDDMVSSGRLSLMRDESLRKQLVYYYSRPIVMDELSYQAFLEQSYFPYLRQLTKTLGIARFEALFTCSGDTYEQCVDSAFDGSELDAIRQDSELVSLLGLQLMQRQMGWLGAMNGSATVDSLLQRLN